jgi:hypothetical protein
MIQPYPAAAQTPALQRPDSPAALLRAVKVMYAGALVCAVHAVIYVLTAGAQKSALARKHPHLSAGHLATLAHVLVIADAAGAAIGAVLFVWIARYCLKGRNGARITGTVVFSIAALVMAYDFIGPETTLNLIFVVAEVLIGLAAVVLLWQRASSAYFAFFKRPQF